MALPGSGPLSMSMVRTEMSQSGVSNYNMYDWVNGYNASRYISPINVLSSASRFTEANPICNGNYSMSAWYNYNHTLSGSTNVTYSLYYHSCECYSSTMLPVELGTTNATFSLNISGTLTGSGTTNIFSIYYGKPWNNGGTGIDGTLITSSGINSINTYNINYTYNYTYNASSGSKIYFVVSNYYCFT